jgi:hypothetical protein
VALTRGAEAGEGGAGNGNSVLLKDVFSFGCHLQV